jgi:hypothetical protein
MTPRNAATLCIMTIRMTTNRVTALGILKIKCQILHNDTERRVSFMESAAQCCYDKYINVIPIIVMPSVIFQVSSCLMLICQVLKSQVLLCQLSLCQVSCTTECHFAKRHSAECHYVKWDYNKCDNAKCQLSFCCVIQQVSLC